jgi:AraC-like DNA-binding protein
MRVIVVCGALSEPRQNAIFSRISAKSGLIPMPMRKSRPTPLGDMSGFVPEAPRPVRVRARSLAADTHFEPHAHPWAQLAYCASGLLQVSAAPHTGSADEVTYIIPPSRAVWIAPGVRHHVTVIEAAEFRTLYIEAQALPPDWRECRMLVVSPLLRELVGALELSSQTPDASLREQWLMSLVLDELERADTQALGVPLPHGQRGDKRLRALCEAVLREPARQSTLSAWAAEVGASERTLARLFREELGMSYQQWRQQVLLAHALPLLARGLPVGQVAALSGYASDSAFSAMFKAAMGQSPSRFQRRAQPVSS